MTVVNKRSVYQHAEGRCHVPDHDIQVTARLRPDGIDIERLAQDISEVVKALLPAERKRLAASGEQLIATAERNVAPTKKNEKAGAA